MFITIAHCSHIQAMNDSILNERTQIKTEALRRKIEYTNGMNEQITATTTKNRLRLL